MKASKHAAPKSLTSREPTKLLTVAQVAAEQPALSQGALRWLIFKASENGLANSGALIRNGRRVLIDLPRFLDWFRGRGQQQRAA